MTLSRLRQSVISNSENRAITVLVDDETFLVPPNGYLQTTGRGDVYLAFAGDAPMVAFPLAGAVSRRAPRNRCGARL